MKIKIVCLGLAVSAFFGAPASAQSQCELHVLPTAKFEVVDNTQSYFTTGGGGLAGNLMGGLMAIKNPNAIRELLVSSFPVDQQKLMLENLDLQKYLKLLNYVIISHDLSEDLIEDKIMKDESIKLSKRVKASLNHIQFGPRLTSSTASCYAELRIHRIYYEKMPLSKKLYAFFVFRKFNTGLAPFFVAARQSGESLNDFPPKSEGDQQAATTQLREAFVKNFTDFSARMVK